MEHCYCLSQCSGVTECLNSFISFHWRRRSLIFYWYQTLRYKKKYVFMYTWKLQSLFVEYGLFGCAVIGDAGSETSGLTEQKDRIELTTVTKAMWVLREHWNIVSRTVIWWRFTWAQTKRPDLHGQTFGTWNRGLGDVPWIVAWQLDNCWHK